MEFEPDLNSSIYINSLGKVITALKPKKGLEIGFCWGMSAYAFLESCRGKLLSLDLDDNKGKEQIFRESYPDRWNILYGHGPAILYLLKTKYDWIYIDGDHQYEAVKGDLAGVLPLLARNGVIACDDYGREGFGVKQAVDEFAKKYGFKIKPIENNPNGAIYLIK